MNTDDHRQTWAEIDEEDFLAAMAEQVERMVAEIKPAPPQKTAQM